MIVRVCFFVLSLAAFQPPHIAHAQEQNIRVGEPATKSQAIQDKSGTVIISGLELVGRIQGDFDDWVSVYCQEFREASSGRRELSLKMVVNATKRSNPEPGEVEKSTSWIDYDEIDSLLKAFELIAKTNSSATKLVSFRAEYITKGDFTVAAFETPVGIRATAASGRALKAEARLPLSSFVELGKLIAKAKEKLDEIKQ